MIWNNNERDVHDTRDEYKYFCLHVLSLYDEFKKLCHISYIWQIYDA